MSPSSRRRGRVPILLVLLLLVAASGRASGAEDPEALIRQGIALRKAGDDSKAQGYFQRAYDVAKTPRSAAQLGLVEYALQLWVPAEAHLAEALGAANDLWIDHNRPALSDSLTTVRAHLGRLVITGSPPGAHVRVADVDRGALPLAGPLYVAPGPVTVAVSAEGHASLMRRVETQAAGEERVDVVLSLLIDPPLAAPVKQPSVESTDSPPSSARASTWMRPLAWGTGVGALALLATGGIALWAANDNYDKFDNQVVMGTKTPICSRQAGDHGGAYCAELLSAGDRDKLIAIIGFAGSAAMAVGSAVLFVSSSKEPSSAGAPVACGPDLRLLAGATCAVRF